MCVCVCVCVCVYEREKETECLLLRASFRESFYTGFPFFKNKTSPILVVVVVVVVE